MKKFASALLTVALTAGAVLAIPTAATAAKTYSVPKGCEINGKQKVTDKDIYRDSGSKVYLADLAPAAGKESVFITTCKDTKSLLVVNNAKGKVIFKKTVSDYLGAGITKATKSTGVTLYGYSTYGTRLAKANLGTQYLGKATLKWNKKAKSFKFTKASTPSWVKQVNSFSDQVAAGKKPTALSTTAAQKKTITKFVSKQADAIGRFTMCDMYKKNAGTCYLAYFSDDDNANLLAVNFKKSGKKHKVTKVKATTLNDLMDWAN